MTKYSFKKTLRNIDYRYTGQFPYAVYTGIPENSLMPFIPVYWTIPL